MSNKKNYLVMWKGGQNTPFPTWNSIVPKNSRPAINGPNNGPRENPNDYAAPFGKPRPLKIWRRQLVPKPESGNGNVNFSIDLLNAPGGSVFIQDVSTCNCTCDISNVPITIYNIPEAFAVGSLLSFNSVNFSVFQTTYIISVSSSSGRNSPISPAITARVYDSNSNLIGTSNSIVPPLFINAGARQTYTFNPQVQIEPSKTYYINFSSSSGFNMNVDNSFQLTGILLGHYYDISCNTANSIKSSIFGNYSYLTPATPNKIYEGTYYTNIALNEYEKCISCDPESNIIKPGMVQPIQDNYTDFIAFLESRCNTYEQNLTTEKILGNTYILPSGEGAWPTDSPKGCQEFNMPSCASQCTINKTVPTIYKPNNRPFATQGGVSSSTRTFGLKQNTLTYYNNAGLSANGLKEINYGRFTEEPIMPYFLKNQFNICHKPIYRRRGNPTACFFTPIANMYRQSKTTTQVYPSSICQRNTTIFSNTNCSCYITGPSNNLETSCFTVSQNTILTTATASFYTTTPGGGTITAFLYDCSNNIALLEANTVGLPYAAELGMKPITFYFANQNINQQPQDDTNYILTPGTNYCIKFIATTSYRYQICVATDCIVVDVEGYIYTKYC